MEVVNKHMKNAAIIFIVSLLVFSSCKPEWEPPFEFSDLHWVVGAEFDADTIFQVNQDDYISFMDLSQGTLSHQWTVSNGAFFLKNNLKEQDTIYIDHIINSDTITDLASAHILFTKPGMQKVHLYNTFNDSVTYRYAPDKINVVDTIPAIKRGDVWVMDTTFWVDVYEIMNPEFKVRQGANIVAEVDASQFPDTLNVAEWDTVTVSVGEELLFENLTTIGRSTGGRWFLEGSDKSAYNANEEIGATFYQMGEFTGSYIDVTRSGDNVPKASAIKMIPLVFKVVGTDAPFEIRDKVEALNETRIKFYTGGKVKSIVNEEANFIVNVRNIGLDKDIRVSRAIVSSEDPTAIELILSEKLYNSDAVTLKYNGGNILSEDGRVLNAFDEREIILSAGNNIFAPLYGDFNKIWQNNRTYFTIIADDIASQNGADNNACKFYSTGDFKGEVMSCAIKNWLLPGASIREGTYQMQIKVYVPSATTIQEFKIEINKHDTFYHTFDISDIKKDSWETLRVNINSIPAPDGSIRINISKKLGNTGVTGDQLMYFDDYYLLPVEERPL